MKIEETVMLHYIKDNLVGLMGIILGFFGLIIFYSELRIRRQLAKNEIKLQEQKFQAQEEQREKNLKQLETLGGLSNKLSEKIADELQKNSRWAVEALERTKLGPYAETLFGERKNHFREEKELTSKKLSNLLLKRFEWLLTHLSYNHIYLCIDSGTTLYPIFKYLGIELAIKHRKKISWVREKKLTIVTNNLPGIETLMEHGRNNPANRFSPLVVNCHVLPGNPLPIYSAVTGEITEEELQRIKETASEGSLFIGLTTGNWVRIRRNYPRCPVPLSRGGRHPEFKQKLFSVCDEVYVVSPLGKIFAEMSQQQVNDMLDLKEETNNSTDNSFKDPSKKSYVEADISSEMAKKVKLVTTRREQERLLSGLSNYLGGQLGTIKIEDDHDIFTECLIGSTPHIQFYFDQLPNDKILEKETEFPHPQTRRSQFIDKFINP